MPEPGETPIWEKLLDIMADVPEEELAKLPADGASQVDHYVYGTPKRELATRLEAGTWQEEES